MDNNIDKLKLKIESNQNSKNILDHEPLTQTLSRIDHCEMQNSKMVFSTTSDGLNLDHKIQIEKAMIQAGSQLGFQEIQVYFKRKEKLQSKSPRQPKEPMSAKSIFSNQHQKKAIPGVTHVIAIASGKGGVGKSTVSSNLAAGLAMEGKRVGLLDADIYGPSSPTMLGMKGQIKISENNKMIPMESHGVKCISFGFLSDSQSPVMWRGPMVAKAIDQLCYDVEWGELDYLVIDLPPGTGDVQLALIENTPITSAIIVSTPQDIALIDVHKGLTMFEKTQTPILGLVENMSVYHCPKCGHNEHIFGTEAIEEFKKTRSIQVLAQVPLHIEIRKAGDSGEPIVTSIDSPQGKFFQQLSREVVSKL